MHRVFHFDFNSVNFTQPNALEETLDYELSQWEKEYGIEAEFKNQFGLRLEKILQVAAEQTGHGAVVLIDEYDKPLLDVLEMDPELLNNNREILKGFILHSKKLMPTCALCS